MNKLPSTHQYAGPNSSEVTIGDLTIWFSYQTPVAFLRFGLHENDDTGLIIRENDWSNTTGKHLNAIDDDKSRRIPGQEFEALLLKAIS